ncbi:hypothetical protein SAMN05192534_11859 [Alteribacillus persepolensis]|uniref:Uncharacterized protein n=1 Tax=Alteribacillus persepolensis TaxID=568899 RepID=A0A1G8H566_9BACI|nr:hypothetical protein [Alteribacillus persepolensis]SDI01794.1 hypothetical protein SAMN05192534_11859 [Alteribacillus persepolensis]
MFRFYLILILCILLTSCSSSPSSDGRQSTQAEQTSFSLDHYTIQFETVKKTTAANKNGFFLHFTVRASDQSRNLVPASFSFMFPEQITDDMGNEYNRFQETIAKRDKTDHHILHVHQFYRGKPAPDSTRLYVTWQLKKESQTTVVFENVTKDMLPVTRDELTLQTLDLQDNQLTIRAEDMWDASGLTWRLLMDDENIRPLFSETDSDERSFHGQYRFAVTPASPYTLTAKRTSSPDMLTWEFPFVLTLDK